MDGHAEYVQRTQELCEATGLVLRGGHWKHDYIPLDLEAAKEKGHGRVPKGWHPSGGGGKPDSLAGIFSHAESAGHVRQAKTHFNAGDHTEAIGALQKADKLEARAGVPAGQGSRHRLAATINFVKTDRSEKQNEYKTLTKRRGDEAAKIHATAKNLISVGDHPRSEMRAASNALIAGNHAEALQHLANAREAAGGAGVSGSNTRGARHEIGQHIANVKALAADHQRLSKFKPRGYA